MSYVDSLLEMVIEEDSIEEYKNNREILQEFHYSKEELQDPEILNKILEKSKQGEKTYDKYFGKISFCLGTSLSIISGILTKNFKLGLASYVPFIIGSLFLTDAALKKFIYTNASLDKNVVDLKNKVIKLKKKSEKIQDKNESKKIIDNCNKVLETIEKYENKRKEERERYFKNKQDLYNEYMDKPYYEDNFSGEFSAILSHLKEKGIPANKVVESLGKNYKYLQRENAFEIMYGRDKEEAKENYPELYKKYMSLADKDGNVYTYTCNDDDVDFVSPVTHKLYSIQTDNKIYNIPTNIYNYYMA